MKVTVKSIKRAAPWAALFSLCLWVLRRLTGTLCVYEALIGLPCPGCGMTRAWVSVFTGNWNAAFFNHPLFWLPPVIVLVFLYSQMKNPKTSAACRPETRRRRQDPFVLGFYGFSLLLLLVVYAARMILFFPHTAPMQPNPDALLWCAARGLSFLLTLL